MANTAYTNDIKAPGNVDPIDFAVLLYITLKMPFWLTAGGIVSFEVLATLVIVAAAVMRINRWDSIGETLKSNWFLAILGLFFAIVFAGLAAAENHTVTFMIRIGGLVIAAMLFASQRPSAKTIYWSALSASLFFIGAIVYSANEAGLSLIDLYVEFFGKGHTYYGRNFFLVEVLRVGMNPFEMETKLTENVNTFSGFAFVLLFLLLASRRGAPTYRGKMIVDWGMIGFMFSFCLTSLSRTSIIIMIMAVILTLSIKAVKNKNTGLLLVYGLLIFSGLLALVADVGLLEGLSRRFFSDQASLRARDYLIEYAYTLIINNPVFGTGKIGLYNYLVFHNLYLGSWAAAGLIGLIFSVLFMASVVTAWLFAVRFALSVSGTIQGWDPDWIQALFVATMMRSVVSGSIGLPTNLDWVGLALGFFVIGLFKQYQQTQRQAAQDNIDLPSDASAQSLAGQTPQSTL